MIAGKSDEEDEILRRVPELHPLRVALWRAHPLGASGPLQSERSLREISPAGAFRVLRMFT